MPAIALVLAVLATAAASPNSTCGDSCVAASDPVLLQLQSQQHRFQNIREELLADDSWKGPISPGIGYGQIWTTRAPRATDYMMKTTAGWVWNNPKASKNAPPGATHNAIIGDVKELDDNYATNKEATKAQMAKWCKEPGTCGVTDPNILQSKITQHSITAVIFFIQDIELDKVQSNNLVKFYKKLGVLEVNRIPFGDFSAPGFIELNLAQQYISEKLKNKQNVLMHCMGGTGRTGTMVVAGLMGLNDLTGTMVMPSLGAAINFAKSNGKPTYIETNAQCAALCAKWPTAGCPVLAEKKFSCFKGTGEYYPDRYNEPECKKDGVPADHKCTTPKLYDPNIATVFKPADCWPCNTVCWGSSDEAEKCPEAPVGSCGSSLNR